jgi:protein TonB
MSDRYIEKAFLYLVIFSLLLHVAVFAVIAFLPQEKKTIKQEPYMVELEDLPPLLGPPAREEKPARRQAEQRRRAPKETAPRGEQEETRLPAQPQPFAPVPSLQRGGVAQSPRGTEKGAVPLRAAPGGESILKPQRQEAPDITQLFPSAGKMAKLEESYRKKYGPEVEEGATKFLNTDDIQFGSFLRRFETAVYGAWRYPQEAARMGIEGVTPVKITFNRKGEVEHFEILESSGSRILDDEVGRTLRAIGPIGGFPKGYDKDTFNLIAFFQYGIIRGMNRGMLH